MKHFGDDVVSFFKKTATKLEELQLQTALGKAELIDKFEEVKKDSRKQYERIKSEVNATIQKDGEKWNKLKAKLEHLEVQLALGKAETKEILEEQKKKLSQAIAEVKKVINDN